MARFKPNQSVVCVIDAPWAYKNVNVNFGPKYGDIVTVESYRDSQYLILKEHKFDPTDGMRIGFDEEFFEPLADISELESILKEQPEHV
jgi:hypothetical protein